MRASDLAQKLLAFSRRQQPHFDPVSIHSVLKATINILDSTIDKTISLKYDFSATKDVIVGDSSQLQSILQVN